jgi:hypothetical protein
MTAAAVALNDLADNHRARWQVKNMRKRAILRITQAARRRALSIADWLDWASEVAEAAQARAVVETDPVTPSQPGERPDEHVELRIATAQLAALVQVLTIAEQSGSPELLERMVGFTGDALRQIVARFSRFCPDEATEIVPRPVPLLPRAPSPGAIRKARRRG